MRSLLHVCLYNTDPASSAELSEAIRSLSFVRLTEEVSTPEGLDALLNQRDVNLVFFHLDPNADAVVKVIDQVSVRYPHVGMIAVSQRTGPDAILAPMRAGCDQFVCEPIDPGDLANAVARVASKRQFAKPKSQCIGVISASGGAGATSIACNLALEVALQTDRPCALVDLDLQLGDVALNFDCEPKYTLFDLAMAGHELDHTVISSTAVSLPCKIALLSRPDMIEHAESITPDLVQQILEMLLDLYENTIVDLPNQLDPTTVAALSQADRILIVCQLLVPSIRNAKRIYDALRRLGIDDERIQIVVNRYEGRGGRVTLKDLENAVQKPVFATVPNDYQYVARSIDFGRPIAALDRNNPVRGAIHDMAEKLTAEEKSESKARPRRGLLGRLIGR